MRLKIEKLISDIPFEVMRQEEINEFLTKNKIKNFIDPHFAPNEISLFNPAWEKYPFSYLAHWRRPVEFLEGPIYLFNEGIDPSDISQGILPDCWFLSALSSLAERPALIERLFITKEYNPLGVYKVRLVKNGEWVVVTVDDYIPCMYNGKPLFASVAKNEIWVSILEKALAKLHGSYSAL